MMDLAVFLGAAALAYALALRFHFPAIPFLILAGWLVSITPIAPSEDMAGHVLQIGLTFLVFSAGIELSPRRFTHQTGAVIWVALVQFVVVGLAGMGVVRWLGYDAMTGVYIGFALSASSTLVVVRHLRMQQQMFQSFGRLVTGVLLVQDVALVVLLVALAAPTETAGFPWAALGGLALLGFASWGCHYWVLPRVVGKLLSDDETLLLLGLATLFLFVGGAHALGLPPVVGAFLAGFALASFPVNGLLRGLIGSVSEFSQALFFTALGSLLVFSSPAVFWHGVILALMVILVTPPVVAFVAEWRGQNSRNGIESGLLLAQTSELGVVFVLSGIHLGHAPAEAFTVVALVAALTMTATSLTATDAVTWKLLHWHPSRRSSVEAMEMSGHIVILGFGSSGMWLARPFLDAGFKIMVVDDDPSVIEELRRRKLPCLRADASDRRILDQVNAGQARLVVASIPRLGDLVQIIRHVRGVPVIARVLEEYEVEVVESEGGTAIRTADAAAEEFFKWFQQKFGESARI